MIKKHNNPQPSKSLVPPVKIIKPKMMYITDSDYHKIKLARAISLYWLTDIKDKSDSPIILHVARVAYACRNLSPDQICAAWLHYIFEETHITHSTISQLICYEVAAIVQSLTRFPYLTYTDYIHRLCTSPLAIPIKIADINDHLLHPDSLTSTLRKRYERILKDLRNLTS